MPLITLTSDFGLTDHYIAAVKAKLYASDPSLTVIDISHKIDNFNIAHASFVLRSVYRDFPEESVHLIAVGASSAFQECIAVRMDKHFFVGPDNGIISLLNDRDPEWIVGLKSNRRSTFAARDVMAPAALALLSGEDPGQLGDPRKDMQRKMHRQLKANKKLIAGNVIHVDHYGNLITNIDRFTFDVLSKDATYRINFGREQFDTIHQCYDDVDFGECALFFNSLQRLEISINQGSATQLLGLSYDSPVHIHFSRS